jgi:bla regulator protein blaR1
MSWLTDTLIATGALIALVLVLRRPVARWFGPGLAYALWALPLLRLVLPPLVLPEDAVPVATAIALAEDEAVQAVTAANDTAALTYGEIAAALWLAGAIGFLVWRVVTYRAMRRRLLVDARPVGEAGAVRLVESPAVPAPVAFGLTDRVIALPAGFMASQDRTARDLAIAHELEHHAARDIAVNFAMQPLLALHWFNPLAWLGWKALRRDQEAACDARVLAGRGADARAAYARLIAGYAQDRNFALAAPLACPMVGEKSIIFRLRSLTMEQPSPRRRQIGRLLIGAAVLALPLTATITYAASEPEAAVATGAARAVKHVVIVDNPAGSTLDDASLHTRVIERDGRTIVLKTPQPVSDQEAEARVAKAEASMAAAEKLAGHSSTTEVTSDGEGTTTAKVRKVIMVRHDGHPVAAPASESRIVHTFVTSDEDGEWAEHGEAGAHAMACKEGQMHEASAVTDKDGNKQVVKVKLCAKGNDMAQALTGLRKARDKVAADSSLPGELKVEVLKELDEEIARLSKEG